MTMAEQLSFLAPQPTHQASATELRLITWNVQHASPARSRTQVDWLAKQAEADVVVLTPGQVRRDARFWGGHRGSASHSTEITGWCRRT